MSLLGGLHVLCVRSLLSNISSLPYYIHHNLAIRIRFHEVSLLPKHTVGHQLFKQNVDLPYKIKCVFLALQYYFIQCDGDSFVDLVLEMDLIFADIREENVYFCNTTSSIVFHHFCRISR